MTEFSKEQGKLNTSTVYHKHYCYRTFFSRFAVRLPSKIADYNDYNIHGGVMDFKFNFTFHNILIYSRAIFNNRVACCVDLIENLRNH